MNLHNLFEDDSRTPNPNYAEELAYQIFKAAPDLDTTGAADEVLDYAYDLVVNDFGKTKANALFAYDEDFDGDLVNAYLDLQMNQQAVDKKQVNEVDPRNFDSDEDYYAALNAPAKRRSAPSDYPYSQEEDDAYFREIFRKKREAAKKAAQDKESGVAESRMSELDAEYEDYKKLSPREFFNMYRITKQAWLAKYKSMLPMTEADAQVNGQDVDVNVVVNKLQKFVANAEQQLQNADYDQQRRYATIVRDRAVKALNMIKQGGNTPEAASAAFKYMQTGEKGVAEELAMQHQRDHKTQKYADTSNSLAKRSISQAEVPNVSKSADGHPTVRGRGDSTRKTYATRVEPTITPTSVKRLGGDRPIPSFLQKNVAEADKKKEDELGSEIRDVGLQRAISRPRLISPQQDLASKHWPRTLCAVKIKTQKVSINFVKLNASKIKC
jgi:hypothetical protein